MNMLTQVFESLLSKCLRPVSPSLNLEIKEQSEQRSGRDRNAKMLSPDLKRDWNEPMPMPTPTTDGR